MTDTTPAVRITDEMIEAGRKAFERSDFQSLSPSEIARSIGDGAFAAVHRAMLAAAPVAPAGEVEGWLIEHPSKKRRVIDAKKYDASSDAFWISPEVKAEHTITALRARSEPEAVAVAWRWKVEGSDEWVVSASGIKPTFSIMLPGNVVGLQPLYAHPAPSDASATERMRAAAQRMADDWQSSTAHHPEHVLVRKGDFEALVAALGEA